MEWKSSGKIFSPKFFKVGLRLVLGNGNPGKNFKCICVSGYLVPIDENKALDILPKNGVGGVHGEGGEVYRGHMVLRVRVVIRDGS